MTSRHATAADGTETVEELQAAADRYRSARDTVDEYGREDLERAAEAKRDAVGLLLDYRDRATDTGTQEFVNYAQFESSLTALVQGLDDDLPGRSAFEDALAAVDKRRLSEDDFDRARDALDPVDDLVGHLDELEAARDDLRDARERAREHVAEHRRAVADCERVLELGEADLDAPVETLRDPIRRWNESVRAGFDELRTDAPARELFAFLDRSRHYPFVDLPDPPEPLREFVESDPAGEEPLARLLEFADFSRSKLEHYVEDPARVKREVATERTFLTGLDAEPLTVGWPPPEVARLRWRARELRSLASRLVDEDAVAALRELRAAVRDEERYEHLRTAAIADHELDAEDRKRLESGAVEADLQAHRDAIDAIEDTLADVPDP